MGFHWSWAIVIWIAALATLVFMSQTLKAVTWISMGLLAMHVTNWLVQAIKSAAPRHMIRDTKGKAVFITGCDTGFGHELALRLDKLGFRVFAGCLFPDSIGATKLKTSTSERLQVVQLDVTDSETIRRAFEFVKKELDCSKERLWALVNNAGIAALTEIEWCPLEVYQRVFDVNTLGLLRVTKTFLPLIRQDEGNRIIIVASLAGRYTFPGFSAYSMSKHAAVSFADALRLEMRKWNISVHTVEPTLYRTPITNENQIQDALDKLWNDCPEDIRKSYGIEYLKDFKSVVSEHLNRAKPTEKIHEVIDDMVDAVAGLQPKCRYVPSLQTQLRCHLLSILPVDVLDNLLAKGTPQTPPADVEGSKRSRFTFDLQTQQS